MLNYIHRHQSEEKFLQMQTLDQFIVHLSQENCWISNEKNVLKTIEYLFFFFIVSYILHYYVKKLISPISPALLFFGVFVPRTNAKFK